MFKAAIRVNKIKTMSKLRGATLHADRHDETGKARVREGAEAGAALAWSKVDNSKDYLGAFKAHKAETGAGERKGADLCLQALCVVSPEWVESAGDLHDAENPRNQLLFEQARAWAESWAGEGAVFGARLDLDEKGGAVVDLMISPVRESRGKPVISTHKALTELKEIAGERNEYSALQTSWADWCQNHLDASIVRGTRREITAREHLSPETYGAVMDKARESLREAPERLQDALLASDLSYDDTEALRDALLLKGEIERHKAEGSDYEPPQGALKLSDLRPTTEHLPQWPYINAIRSGAEHLIQVASRFGMDQDSNSNDRYENGRELFPNLIDRMHLSAVVAKCGAFCAKIEAAVKNIMVPEKASEFSADNFWPQGAAREVERHERNLGITLQMEEPKIDFRETEFEESSELEKDDGLDLS